MPVSLQSAFYGDDKQTYFLSSGPAAFPDALDICESTGLEFVGYNTTRANMRAATLAVDTLCERDACWVRHVDVASTAGQIVLLYCL